MGKSTMQKNGQNKEFEEVLIDIARVTKVTAGGRQLRFRATVVIGNKKGKVGLGLGKSNEVTGAIQKAVNHAKKTMIKVPLINGTIPHDVKVKFKSAKILLMPAKPGTGIIAGSSIRQIVELAGVKDILGKRFGTTNKISNAKAAMKALAQLREVKSKETKDTNTNVTTEEEVNEENVQKAVVKEMKKNVVKTKSSIKKS